ncbi:MAG: 8-oxo-dGTP diphosphatase [Solobacterium sp.]|nr:8-oxo-dGTP diphosphatase [Solobacterium sp.]MBR0214204.1 8-oxo-dGTP diphosphatase [Solobacterium sp.]
MSLCYLQKDGRWLMLLRNRKENDINAGKWIGTGGKIEPGETPRQGALREIREETGFIADTLDFRGILYFIYGTKDAEKMWVYSSHDFHGTQTECNEGTLAWIPEDEILALELWPGDRAFLKKMLSGDPQLFCLELNYDDDGNLVSVIEREEENE